MTRILSIASAFLVLAASAAMAPAKAQTTEGVAALVNDQPITTVDVRDRMRLIIASTGLVQLDTETLERIQDQALRGLVDESLQLQTAAEYEIQVTDEEITASLLDLADRSNTTLETILSDLQSSGVDVSTLRQQIEAEIAWQLLVSGRYGSRVRISNQQIDLALERIAASASEPQFRIFEIFFEVTNSTDENQAIQRVVTVMDQLQQGVSFPDLARQFSDAASAASGGDIGWINASQLPPEVAGIIPQMMQQYQQSGGRGALSNPIRVPGGFMVIALVAARDGTTVLQYDLTQISIPTSAITDESRAAFERAISRDPVCADAEAIAAEIDGAIITPLGTISADSVLPAIREALVPLDQGGNTGIMDSPAGIQTILVCDRSIGGPGVPTREDIEADLRSQQLSLLSRRWLRDLRRDSTVEIRE